MVLAVSRLQLDGTFAALSEKFIAEHLHKVLDLALELGHIGPGKEFGHRCPSRAMEIMVDRAKLGNIQSVMVFQFKGRFQSRGG